MSTKIRLARLGRRNLPFYHIVIADSRSPRDGKFIENIGYYDPIRADDVKNRLISEFLNRVYGYYSVESQTNYVEQHRNHSLVIGKQVALISSPKFENIFILGIDDECRLLVKYSDGTKDCYPSGEISICL